MSQKQDLGILARVVLVYVAFSALWILVSDTIVQSVAGDLQRASNYQTAKGLLFVVASAAVIFFLLRRELRARRAAESSREAAAAEQERTYRELLSSEARYRSLFEHSLDALLITSPKGQIHAANPAACRVFGRTEGELRKLGRDGIVDLSDPRLEALLKERARTGEAFGIITMVRGDGTTFKGEVSSSVFDTQAGKRSSLIIRDVSERIAAERALERNRELAAARDRAESADRMKSAFLATMSHELRTPLNSIIGFTGILLQQIPGELNDEQRKQLDMVRGSARHLLALINDVLDISKIEAGQLTVEQERFDVAGSARAVARSFEELARAKGLSMTTDIAPDLPEITGDRRRYEQVMLNLLGNAIKFTEAGSVSLFVGLADGGVVESVVKDTGVGIEPREHEAIFMPFHQVEHGTSRRHEGTGLGLSVSRRLVGLMGGRIWVTSVPGEGSAFGFTVPTSGAVGGKG